jgi:hypothetical protein
MRVYKRLPVLIFTVALAPFFLACGGDDGDGNNGNVDSGLPACTPQGDHTYVVNKVNVPQSPAEAVEIYGFDLDGDGRTENKVGTTLANLGSALGVNVTAAVDGAINQGSAILLMNVQASDLTNASCAGVSVYLGANPDPAPCADAEDTVCGRHLDGSGSFEIAANSPADARLLGRIVNGAFAPGASDVPGKVTIELPVVSGLPPLRLSLVGARIEIEQVSDSGLMQGRLGGAVPVSDVQESVLPTIHALISGIIAQDCTGEAPDCCENPSSQNAQILDLFDENKDCQVPQEELEQNSIISTLLNPDVDLLDDSGNYAPNKDGARDSLSLGIGFTATTATFTP